MKIVKKSIIQTRQRFLPVVIRSLATLIPLLIILTGLHEYFLVMEKYNYGNNQLILAKIGQVLTGLMESSVLILLLPLRFHEVAQNKPPRSWMGFAQKHFMPLCIESLRSFTSVILWSLLLILPGFYRYVRLIFVPLVVYFDPNYQNHDIDALKRSNKLSSGVTLYIFILIILSTAFFYASHNWLGNLSSFTRIPGLFVIKTLNMGVSIFFYGILYSVYRQKSNNVHALQEEGQNEPNV